MSLCWHAMRGKCNDPDYPGNGAEKVEDYTNWNLVGLNGLTIGEWFSDIEFIQYDSDDEEAWFGINGNDPNPGDGIIDYFEWLVFGDNGGYYVYCLEHDEMNYYLNNAETEAQKFEVPLNKQFMNIDMKADLIPGLGNYPLANGQKRLTYKRLIGKAA